MWFIRSEELDAERGSHFAVDFDSRPATFADVLRGWGEDETFRSKFNNVLAESRFAAFRWEVPPVTETTAKRQFEFVLLNSPGLARRAEPEAFAQHFVSAGDRAVLVFPNVGGDALMVVPCPLAAHSSYGHLAAFVRSAPEWQRHALWRAVGETMAARLGDRPVWLSTAGAGVSWLHVRLDDLPKYYAYGPYKNAA